MISHKSRVCLLTAFMATLPACVPDFLTDAATRIAYDIESQASDLGREEGARYSIDRITPRGAGECEGPYTAQFDKVGALIVWCKDAAGKVLTSGSTSYHARFIDTPQTYIVDKAAGATLSIDIERRAGRAVVMRIE